ncbi:hypothetical protein Lal_00050036 [Lupinus albus]|nr:hypothetical protein Lal_00050036 [Lupinus albus]
MENLVNQYSSTISEKTLMFPYDEVNNECYCINIYANLIPQLRHDYYMGVSFENWRKHIDPVTKSYILTCDTKEQAIEILNLEREQLLEQLWWQREYVRSLQRTKVVRERNWKHQETKVEQEFECTRMELEKCRRALEDVKKQIGEYKTQHQHELMQQPIEQPEWIAKFLKHKLHTKENY